MSSKLYVKTIKGRRYYYRREKVGDRWRWVYVAPVEPSRKLDTNKLVTLLLEKIKELDRTRYAFRVRKGLGYSRLEKILREALELIELRDL